ncbi:MAG: chemotaxis protein CheW [Gammaproteobacteria bacterium]|nr:chemotaxis protein CheW [Gammaproteobacteria bacterium]
MPDMPRLTCSPRTLLIFDLNGARFGVDATLVRESVWLPEPTPVEEAPPHIIGIFSLRGQIVPITDLSLRFGHAALHYRLSDQILVLELENLLMGLIVSEVIEVIEVSAEAIQPPPKFDDETPHHAHLVAGEVRVGDDLVTLLDANQLAHLPSPLPLSTSSGQSTPPPGGEGALHFCPQATPQEHAAFRARAKALMEAPTEEDGARLSLAVVELGGEYFGIELQAVQEFCDIAHPSPIPCCPPHILGAVNLRGNLLTLLDVRGALNLPRAVQCSGKAVIARASTTLRTGIGEQLVGVAVDEVHDVVYLREEALQAAPSALREQHGAEIKGMASYAGKMMAVLDLPALLAREEWIVNESV